MEREFSLDIETLSTKPNAHVLSVGIACSNGDTMEVDLPPAFQKELGRHVEDSTLNWWQADERIEMFEGLRERCQAMERTDFTIQGLHREIENFIGVYPEGEPPAIWMNSPAFDGVILETLFADCHLKTPWHYRAPRDFRTLKNLAFEKNPRLYLPPPPENQHNCLVDAECQLKQVAIFKTELTL